MTSGRYCKRWFPRSLWSKQFVSRWVIFSMVRELMFFFLICREVPHVNRASQVTLRDLEPNGTETFIISCKSQLATRAVHNGAAAWVGASGGIFEKLHKSQVCVPWRRYHEVKLHLCFKFIVCYAFLLFCAIYSQQSLPSILRILYSWFRAS